MISHCTALILAGGESRRMGQDKASLLLGERTLLQNVATTLQPLFAEIMVSVRQPRADIDFPQVCDPPLHCGPLAGLAAGLERATAPWIFAVACDMPFITPNVIAFLASQREACQAVVPIVQGHPQPLAAFYSVSCLGAVKDCLDSTGKHSMRALLEKLQVRYVDEEELITLDSTLRSFFDLDTPQDVEAAINEVTRQ